MGNQVLMIVSSVFSAVYGMIFAKALKTVRNFPKTLEEIAEDTKPSLSPSQQARLKDKDRRSAIVSTIITLTFVVILVLSLAVPDAMKWSLFPIDSDSSTAQILQIMSIVLVSCSWALEWWSMRAFSSRMDFLTAYYSCPIESRPARSDEKESEILRRGPHRFFRAPLSAAFRLMAASVALSSLSWLLTLLMGLLVLGNEVLVVELDSKWERFFLDSAYERYVDETGGQFLCSCFTGFEKRLRRMMAERFAQLAERDGFAKSSDIQSRVVYVGSSSIAVDARTGNGTAPAPSAVVLNSEYSTFQQEHDRRNSDSNGTRNNYSVLV